MVDDSFALLQEKTIVLTRAEEQQSEARLLLENSGARVLDLPALVIGPPDHWEPLDDALAHLENFHWLIFSSANGVRAVEKRLQHMGKSLAVLPSQLKVAVVGRKTALCLQKFGSSVDFIPPNFLAESLIEHFPVSGLGLRILLPRVQTGGRALLAEAFGMAGAHVVEVPAYESCCPDSIPEKTIHAFSAGEVDAIAFTSSKTAIHTAQLLRQSFGREWHGRIDHLKIISIGPQTSISCKKYFSKVDKEADPHDLEGLLNACIEAFQLER